MTVQDLIKHFHTDNKAKLGRLVGVHRATVLNWLKYGIPYGRQLQIEKITQGELRAQKDE